MKTLNWQNWTNPESFAQAKDYICGYCGKDIGTQSGWRHRQNPGEAYVCICPKCGCPTAFIYGVQQPGPSVGKSYDHLPDDVNKVYSEIRDCIKYSLPTAATMLSRKLLVHLAISAGAQKKDVSDFVGAVNYLADNGYVPKGSDVQLHFVRKAGGKTNHTIVLGDQEEALKMLRFIESLLYFMYEMNEEFVTAGVQENT